MNTAIIIQARMGASRLPGKVLLPMGDSTVLGQVCRRVGAAFAMDTLIVAITDCPADDQIAEWAKGNGLNCYRGAENDVLSRYYHAAKAFNADIVIRVTADCPCIDPNVISGMLGEFLMIKPDYISNTLKRSFPHGLDVEIFTFAALERAFNEALEPPHREHVTPYIYRSGKFACANYMNAAYHPGEESIRITLDTPSDYALLTAIYNMLGANFHLPDIVAAFVKYPWLAKINAETVQKKVYDSLDEETDAAASLLRLSGMDRACGLMMQAYHDNESNIRRKS